MRTAGAAQSGLDVGALDHVALARVIHVPRFEMLDTSANVREGTLSHDYFRKVRDLLNPHGRIALVLSYHTGARAGELRQIRIDRIDFKSGRINLPGFTTKNGKPRYLPIFGDMAAEIETAIRRRLPAVGSGSGTRGVRCRNPAGRRIG
jgi:integrase